MDPRYLDYLPPPEEEFASAANIRPVGQAPHDGTPIVGRDSQGRVAHIRWRTHPDVDVEDDDPYWARWDTDEIFEPVAWVPTSWTYDDLVKTYG